MEVIACRTGFKASWDKVYVGLSKLNWVESSVKPDSFHVTAELKLNVCFIENNVNNLTFSTSILLPASLKVFMSQMMVLDGRLKTFTINRTLFFIFKAA